VIVYRIACGQGHEFEGWFKNSAAYDKQQAQGALACPVCGDADIRKAPMAPSVSSSGSKKETPPPMTLDPQKTRQFMAGFRKFVEKNAEYVGPRFPEEARKIHHGETEDRHIYGEATLKEAKELVDEGITIAPLPSDPDKLN
jgi:hypothetical protein